MKSSLTTSTEPLVPEVVEEGGVGALTEREAARLEALERRIDTNARAFMDVGAALAEIREARLYRQTHGTFEEYVRQRWEFSRARAYQLVDSSAAARNVNNCGHGIVPANEAQARPLALLAESDQVEVWDRVVETAQDGKITAKAVAAAVAEHLGKKKSQKARTIRDGATTDPELPEDLRAYVAGLVDKVRGLTEKAHRAAMLKYLDGLRNLLQD